MAGRPQTMSNDDKQTIAKLLVRYSSTRPKVALQRLMGVELIRNNMTKKSLYNMLLATKRILFKDGKRSSYMGKEWYKRVLSIKENHNIRDFSDILKFEGMTKADETFKEQDTLVTISTKLNNLERNYSEIMDNFNRVLTEVTLKKNEYENSYNLIKQELIEKKNNLLKETHRNLLLSSKTPGVTDVFKNCNQPVITVFQGK